MADQEPGTPIPNFHGTLPAEAVTDQQAPSDGWVILGTMTMRPGTDQQVPTEGWFNYGTWLGDTIAAAGDAVATVFPGPGHIIQGIGDAIAGLAKAEGAADSQLPLGDAMASALGGV